MKNQDEAWYFCLHLCLLICNISIGESETGGSFRVLDQLGSHDEFHASMSYRMRPSQKTKAKINTTMIYIKSNFKIQQSPTNIIIVSISLNEFRIDLFVFMYMFMLCRCSWRPEDSVKCPGAGVTDDWELWAMSVQIWIQVLWKSKCS